MTTAPVSVAVPIHKNARPLLGEAAFIFSFACSGLGDEGVPTAHVYSTWACYPSMKTIQYFRAASYQNAQPQSCLIMTSLQSASLYLIAVAFRASSAMVFAPARSSTLIFHSNICPFVKVAPIK